MLNKLKNGGSSDKVRGLEPIKLGDKVKMLTFMEKYCLNKEYAKVLTKKLNRLQIKSIRKKNPFLHRKN